MSSKDIFKRRIPDGIPEYKSKVGLKTAFDKAMYQMAQIKLT